MSPKKRCSRRSMADRHFCPPIFPCRRSTTRPTPPTRPSSRSPSPPTACPCRQVEDMVDTRLAPKFSQLAGVGLVSISGGQKPAVRIQVNPVALSSYGLNMEDVRTALVQASVNSAKGNFDGPRQDYQIDANDQISAADDYKNVVIAYSNGAPVFVKDVANVVNGVENTKQAAWMGHRADRPAHAHAGRHSEHPAPAGRQHHHRRQLHPEGSAATGSEPSRWQSKSPPLTDMTTSIQASVHDVEFELGLTIGLVVHGDLSLPAQPARHHHSHGGRAAFAHRHPRRDVPARLLARQPVADGAHHLHRLRGRRRHRDDREHQPLP